MPQIPRPLDGKRHQVAGYQGTSGQDESEISRDSSQVAELPEFLSPAEYDEHEAYAPQPYQQVNEISPFS